jgi:GNAT superfamily N-acetyltransferase
MTAPREIAFRPATATPEALSAYGTLLSATFAPAPKFTPDALAWRYRHNPAGEVVGTDAWSGDALAAHYVTCPAPIRLAGRNARGLLSLNTATHPDLQGRGLFVRLAEQTYERAAAAGFDCVFGVANANSTPGFVRRLGFQLVQPLDAGVLLSAPRHPAPAELAFEGLWDAPRLAWRLANPAGRYRRGRSGDLAAVWSPTHLPLVHCAAFLQAPPLATAGAPLGAQLFIGLDPRLRAAGLRLAPLPDWLRPSPLNLIYRPLAAGAPAFLEAQQVALNFLDFDPY